MVTRKVTVSREPTAAAGAFFSILAFAERRVPGLHVRLARDVLGVAMDRPSEDRLPSRLLFDLLAAAADATGDDCLGLHLALAERPTRFDVLHYIYSSSGTLCEGFRRAERFLPLWNEGVTLRVRDDPSALALELVLARPEWKEHPGARHLLELATATLLVLARTYTLAQVTPRAVDFVTDRPASTAEQQALFGELMGFRRPATQVVFAREVGELPMASADTQLGAILLRYAEELVVKLPAEESWTRRVREAALASLQDGAVDLARIAKALGASERSLQRRLADEGTSFQALADEIRYALACRYLDQREPSLSEIAYLLGFHDLSGFYRAFRRWSGTTPIEYRSGRR
jgi:AraC-like DNA-binding protein